MSKIIRRAKESDIPRLVELKCRLHAFHADFDAIWSVSENAREVFRSHFTKTIESEDSCVFVLDIDCICQGYGIANVNSTPISLKPRRYGFINDLYICDDVRRRGYGRQLFNQMVLWVKSRGVNRFEVSVVLRNNASTAFWDSMGFTPIIQRMIFDSL